MREAAHKRCKTCNWLAGKAEWLAHQRERSEWTTPPYPELMSGHWGKYVAEVGHTEKEN